jgi:hypothetical protein
MYTVYVSFIAYGAHGVLPEPPGTRGGLRLRKRRCKGPLTDDVKRENKIHSSPHEKHISGPRSAS